MDNKSVLLDGYEKSLTINETKIKKNSKRILVIIISIIIVISLILAAGFIPFEEVKVLSITQTPENPQPFEEITVTAQITGGSFFLGPMPRISYRTIRKNGGGSGSMSMRSIGNDKYSWTTSAGDGTIIWYMILSGGNLLVDNIIQAGFNEAIDEIITIENFNQIPKKPTSETEEIEIFVDIDSHYNITTKRAPYKYQSGSSGGSGSGPSLALVEGTSYKVTFTPDTIHGSGFFMDNNEDYKFQEGMKIYYRIVVFDEENNAAVSPTQIITIS